MPASPSHRSRMPLTPVINPGQNAVQLGQEQECVVHESPSTSSRVGDLRQTHQMSDSGGRRSGLAADPYYFSTEEGGFTMSPLAHPYQRLACLQASRGNAEHRHPTSSPTMVRERYTHCMNLRASDCSSEASFLTIQRNAAICVQSLQIEVR